MRKITENYDCCFEYEMLSRYKIQDTKDIYSANIEYQSLHE